jgi:predicted dehydrogenase
MRTSGAPLRVGIVGLGRSGWDIHARELKGRKDFRVVAVADPLPERRAEAERELGCRAFPDLTAMLRGGGLDVVVVASKSVDHGPHTFAALAAGCHVVCEKPMAMSAGEADAMIRAAKRARRTLFIHQNYRFNDEYRHLREVLDSGTLGRVFQVSARWSGYARRNDWQTLRKNGGGVLNNTGPHLIDMALDFLDAPVADVWGDLQHIKDAGDCEDHVKVLVRGTNGRVCDLELSTATASPVVKWTILGSHGALVSDGTTSTLRTYDPARVPKLVLHTGAAPNRRYGVNGTGETLPWKEATLPAKPKQRGGGFYDNVAAVLLRGAKMVVTPEQARDIMRTIDRARRGTKFAGPASRAGRG